GTGSRQGPLNARRPGRTPNGRAGEVSLAGVCGGCSTPRGRAMMTNVAVPNWSASAGADESGELMIVDLSDATEADLESFYSEILTHAFPPDELITWDELSAAAVDGIGPGVLVHA